MKLKYLFIAYNFLFIFLSSSAQTSDKDRLKAINFTAKFLSEDTKDKKYELCKDPTEDSIKYKIREFQEGNKKYLNFLLSSHSTYKNYEISERTSFPDFVDSLIIFILKQNDTSRHRKSSFINLTSDLIKLKNNRRNSASQTSTSQTHRAQPQGDQATTTPSTATHGPATQGQSTHPSAATATQANETPDIQESSEGTSNINTPASDTPKTKTPTIAATGNKQPPKTAQIFVALTWILLIIVISAGGLIFWLSKMSSKKLRLIDNRIEGLSIKPYDENYKKLSYFEKLDKIYSTLGELNDALKRREEDISRLNDADNRHKATSQDNLILVNKLKMEIEDLKKTRLSQGQSDPISQAPPVPPPPPIRYAICPDHQAGGFSFSSLKPEKERKSIYRITMQDETSGTYEIVNEKEIFKIALDSFTQTLEPGCNFDNSPGDGENIKTLKPGRIRKDGDFWKIEQKALISFF